MQITLQIPEDLERRLLQRASQLNIPLETLILESLTDLVELSKSDDTPNEVVLASLRASLEAVKADKIYPIEELWDGIDE